jgi:hypothetical protein
LRIDEHARTPLRRHHVDEGLVDSYRSVGHNVTMTTVLRLDGGIA